VQPQLTRSDLEHVKLLGIFHYVMAAMHCIGVCVGGIYVFMGAGMAATFRNLPASESPPAPEFADMMGTMFGVLGAGIALFSLGLVLLTAYAGFSLHQHQRRTFCLVIAGIQCLSFPLGTALGVFTIIVLMRPAVSDLFEYGLPDEMAA
jgi:di/tricarboxylate transporter